MTDASFATMGGGDLVARFVQTTRPFHERLFRIALTLCRDRDQAADLTQEALIRAFRAFDRFREGEAVLPWLARILRNLHLDTFKTGRARHEVAAHQLSADRGDPLDFQPSRVPDPLAALERSRLSAFLTEELEALDPDHRLVVILCDIEEFSYQEAADVAGIPIGTVRSRLSRCREHLRQRLLRRMEEGNLTGGKVVPIARRKGEPR